MTNIIEGEATIHTVEDALIDYANGVQIGDEWLNKLVDAGYVADVQVGALTDRGLDYAEQAGVPMRLVPILTLGVDIHAVDKTGVKRRILAGSQVQVIMKNWDKHMRAYGYDVLAGNQFYLLTVYANKAHTLTEHRWPMNLPIGGTYRVSQTDP